MKTKSGSEARIGNEPAWRRGIGRGCVCSNDGSLLTNMRCLHQILAAAPFHSHPRVAAFRRIPKGSATQTAERRRVRVLISLGVSAGLAGFVAVYPSRSLGQEARPSPAVRQMMTEAAVARIAAESRGTLREPAIEAAPRSSEATSAADRTARSSRPSPPGGYSFVSHHGRMPRARIEDEYGAGAFIGLPFPPCPMRSLPNEPQSTRADSTGRATTKLHHRQHCLRGNQ